MKYDCMRLRTCYSWGTCVIFLTKRWESNADSVFIKIDPRQENRKRGYSMRGVETRIQEIRHRIFREVARMAYHTEWPVDKRIEELPYKIIPGEVGNFRNDVFLERAIAVSYTHLDVYKRQLLHCPGIPGRTFSICPDSAKGQSYSSRDPVIWESALPNLGLSAFAQTKPYFTFRSSA